MADGPIPVTPEAAVELWSRDDRRARHIELGLCVACLGPQAAGEDCYFCTVMHPYLDALVCLSFDVWDLDSPIQLGALPALTADQRGECERAVAVFGAGRQGSRG